MEKPRYIVFQWLVDIYLEDVGKSFLDDPICGEVEAWWEFPGFNFHIDLHR